MIRKVFPHPILTLTLTLAWMALMNAITLGTLVFGLILGIVIPLVTAPYWPDRPVIRNWTMAVEYTLVVLWDIVVANFQVARIILFKRNEDIRSVWITVPIELRTAEAITVLAGTITMTPGTVSSDLSADGRSILVHCLDTDDPDGVRDQIKQRYERRLKEIFE